MRRSRSEVWLQTAAAVVACAFVAWLQWGSEGLWYQGDSPRHAMNGFFWADLLVEMPSDPKQYALGYYARYPAINPSSYPPFFYLLEGAAFRLLGPSPWAAKGLVLLFGLVCVLYLSAWLRRWVSIEAGWGAVLLALQPGFVRWGNAVMLNLPAAALAFVAMYYARRWTDHAIPRHLYLSMLAMLLAVLTYFPAGFAAPAVLVVMFAERRSRLLRSGRMMLLAATALAVAIPLLFLVSDVAPLHFAHAGVSNLGRLTLLDTWTYYPTKAPEIFSSSILALFLVSPVVAFYERTNRREIFLLWLWCLAVYLCLSVIWARDERYALLVLPPIVASATTTVLALARRWAPGHLRRAFLGAIGALVGLNVATASAVRLPPAEGFGEVARFFETQGPDARILYEGVYDGVFTFHIRAGDPGFRRAVVRGGKLLYSSAIFSRWHLTEYVSGPEDVVERLRTGCGCEWIVLERPKDEDRVEAVAHLRTALRGPEFEHVATFPIRSTETPAVDVYRFLIPFETPETLELPFPILGDGARYRARPIER